MADEKSGIEIGASEFDSRTSGPVVFEEAEDHHRDDSCLRPTQPSNRLSSPFEQQSNSDDYEAVEIHPPYFVSDVNSDATTESADESSQIQDKFSDDEDVEDEGIDYQTLDDDDDGEWVGRPESEEDNAFGERQSMNSDDGEDALSNEEVHGDDDSSSKSEDVHAWHDELANNETASLTDESYNNSIKSQESLKSHESFELQPPSSLRLEDEIAASLGFNSNGNMNLHRQVQELLQQSQLVPSFSTRSPPPTRRQDIESLTSSPSEIDVETGHHIGKKQRLKKEHDSDTTSDSEASIQANHDDSDTSSSSSSDGTQM